MSDEGSPATYTAASVQQRLLGRDGQPVQGLTPHAAFHPCDEAGGDLWMLERVGRSDALLLLGDATGHGLGAAMVTAIVAGGTQMARLGMGDKLQPFMLANLLNHCLLAAVDGDYLMTALCARFDPERRLLTMVNAGHPAPRLLREGEVVALKGTGQPPVGSTPRHRFEQTQHELQPGDVLVLFTDGLTEAADDAGSELGERRVHEVCEAHAERSAADVRDALLAAAAAHTGGLEALHDDLTLVVIEVE